MPLPHSIIYPKTIKNANDKRTYKQNFLMDNPENLWSDTAQIGGKPTTTNLLLHTDDCDSRHRAICKHYRFYKKRGICKGRQIQINKEGDNNNNFLQHFFNKRRNIFVYKKPPSPARSSPYSPPSPVAHIPKMWGVRSVPHTYLTLEVRTYLQKHA